MKRFTISKSYRGEWISCLNSKLCTVNWTGSALQNTGCWCTIFPFPSGWMKGSKQFTTAYCFGVQIIPNRLPSHVEVGSLKSSQDLFRDRVGLSQLLHNHLFMVICSDLDFFACVLWLLHTLNWLFNFYICVIAIHFSHYRSDGVKLKKCEQINIKYITTE